MLKKITLSLLVATGLFAEIQGDISAQIFEKMSKNLPNTKIDKVIPSSVMNGIYEVYAGKNILYTNEFAQRVIVGHIFTFEGKDLTQKQLDMVELEVIKKSLDLSKALRIGNGKHEVIVFTDTECPFCRKAEELIKDGDMTKYVFFTPLAFHKKAIPQSIHILCSNNPQKEYEKAMNGKLDDTTQLTNCKEGEDRLKEMMKFGEILQVAGTPLFYIDGKKISGANPALSDMVK